LTANGTRPACTLGERGGVKRTVTVWLWSGRSDTLAGSTTAHSFASPTTASAYSSTTDPVLRTVRVHVASPPGSTRIWSLDRDATALMPGRYCPSRRADTDICRGGRARPRRVALWGEQADIFGNPPVRTGVALARCARARTARGVRCPGMVIASPRSVVAAQDTECQCRMA